MRESLCHEEFFVVFEMAASVASSFNFFQIFFIQSKYKILTVFY